MEEHEKKRGQFALNEKGLTMAMAAPMSSLTAAHMCFESLE